MLRFFKKKKETTKKIIENVEEDFTNVEEVASYFYNETGITFEKQMGILKSKVTSFCRCRNINSFTQLLKDVEQRPSLKQEIIDYLTTNETYFYREFKQIKELVEIVKDISENVSILCAPSATGEEPYSIAIALLEAKVPTSKFKIVGIDINKEALEKSKIALYSARNVRNLSVEILQKYFVKENQHYRLNDEVKNLVEFHLINIFDESFQKLGKFDFVFSRNMLIYFDNVTKEKAKTILENAKKNKNYKVFFGHADLF